MSNQSKAQMCLHTGGVSATLEQIENVKIPERTKTYEPVSHMELIRMVKEEASRSLKGYEFIDEAYGVSPKSGETFGQKLFGVQTYRHEDFDIDNPHAMNLAIGVRNSYDQSLSAGVVAGNKVFVCDNLCFSGEIRVSRKHTGDAMKDLTGLVRNALAIAPAKHRSIEADAELMQEFDLTDDQAFAILGVAYGREILKPRQLLRSRQAWNEPPQEAFEERNLWSLYNAMTEALKSSTAREVLESHTNAHALVMNEGMEIAEGFAPRMVA